MALKGDREILATNIDYKIETGKDAARGVILVASSTAGEALVPSTTALTSVGTEDPVGLLLDDVENLDYTTIPQKWMRNVVPRGSEVSLLEKGWVKTNLIEGAGAPTQGDTAYLAASGWVSNREHVTGSGIIVGYWRSGKDADGYAKLYVDLTGRKR